MLLLENVPLTYPSKYYVMKHVLREIGWFKLPFPWFCPVDSQFSENSHGFRPCRGPKTFFRALKEWPALDRIIQCDVVKFQEMNLM